MANAPLVNGYRFSYSSLEIAAQIGAGKPQIYVDVDDISYSDSLEVEFKRGTSRGPIGWTAGNYNPGEASMQMGKSTCAKMITQIGPGYMGINLILNVAYADLNEPLTVDTITGRIIGIEDSHAHGPGPLVSVVRILPFQILRSGITPLLNRVF